MDNVKKNAQTINKNFQSRDNTNIINLLRDVVVISIGLMISSFGTSLFYAAELGSSPMATFCDGVHTILGISYGMANTLVNMFLLVVLFFLNRKYINIGTILCVFAIGPFVNLFTPLLVGLGVFRWNIILRVLCTMAGTLLMGIGLGLYVAVNHGFGALEGLVKILCDRNKFSYSKVKIMQDIILVAGGISLSARWGVGTIIAILFTGPALEVSLGFFSRFFGTAVS